MDSELYSAQLRWGAFNLRQLIVVRFGEEPMATERFCSVEGGQARAESELCKTLNICACNREDDGIAVSSIELRAFS